MNADAGETAMSPAANPESRLRHHIRDHSAFNAAGIWFRADRPPAYRAPRPGPRALDSRQTVSHRSGRMLTIASRTSSAEVRTPSFWRMIEDVLATVLY